jgi:acyl-CoA reductase-like NAD-dependent aldehyde dehydrogenase
MGLAFRSLDMDSSNGMRGGDAKLQAPAFDLWINGRRVPARSGRRFERASPFDGVLAATFADGDEADAQAAIAAARAAFDDGPWPRSAARTRFQVLMRVAELLERSAEAFIERMVRESGKPRTTARGELGTAIRTFQYYAGQALDLEGKAISDRTPNAFGMVLREPVGVAGLITPWNFPILNPVVKIAPALAAGCTIVTKPSHLCSGPTVLLAELLSEAGLPDGAFNVVTSEMERGAIVGQAIAASPLVDKIAFTGSTRTGQAVMRTATGSTKRVSLELGGKSANIVFADAALDEAAAVSVNAFCFNSGQQCSAASRLLVEDRVHDRFVEALVANAARQVIGDPAEEATTMGPLVNEEQFRRVQGYIDIGRKDGKLVAGGGPPEGTAFGNSLFVAPTIFDEMDNCSRLAQEEVFGPVLSVICFKSEADAIRLANDSRYGLAGGVWCNSINTAIRVVKAVRTGKMFVNSYNNAGIDDLPHGGYKDSGIGREQGPDGLAEYQQVKTVQIRLCS